MRYGDRFEAGLGWSTVLASMDFETYSEAGFVWDDTKWRPLVKGKPGIAAVGAWVYSEHPSTEVLTFAFDLKDGFGPRLWTPDDPPPWGLFEMVESGHLFEAVNSFFEFAIWTNVCVRRYGWPQIQLAQVRDVAAKAGSFTLPRKLEKMGAVLNTDVQKDKAGTLVMRKVSKPRTPTKHDDRMRFLRADEPQMFFLLDSYCIDDVRTEDACAAKLPDLSEFETRVFLADQSINTRGVHIDAEAVDAAISIIAQAEHRYNEEIREISGGMVGAATEVQKIKDYCGSLGFHLTSLTKDDFEPLLANAQLDPRAKRVIEIRQIMSAQSVKKARAMHHRMSPDHRIRGLYTYAGAARTWRWSGAGVQPQNLPNAGPPVVVCTSCSEVRWAGLWFCPRCYGYEHRPSEWGIDAAESCLAAVKTGSLDTLEMMWGDALTAIAGCLRSMFTAGPGNELICSDFTAIEAVVLAAMAEEEWRLEVFRTHGKIYEMSAAKIFKTPFGEFARYKAEARMNHPLRKKGKVAELASGYQGWIEAWKRMGAEGTDEEIKQQVIGWRRENPNIVEFWAGLEECAKWAVQNPGQTYSHKCITYQMKSDVLYAWLPSGRAIPYQSPRIFDGVRHGKANQSLSYMGVDAVTKQWTRIDTYGGKLTENATQAVARDHQANAILNLEAAGYPIVLHTHDEAAAEIPIGAGSVEHYESVMCQLEPWCREWPIKAAGGWRGDRYRKD